MEAAARLEERGVDLALAWIPRDVNAEADALSHFKCAGFAAENRVHADLATLPFLVIARLRVDAKDFYGQACVIKAAVRGLRRKRAARPEDRLRVRDPW